MLKKEYSKDLTRLNTFGMKVTARYFYEYDSLADLLDLDFEDLARPVKHIGGGSNLLFTGDFPGTLLHSAIRFTEILSESADEVTVSVSGAFADKNAGSEKTVNLTYELGGAQAGNYVLDANAAATADINKIQLSISGTSVADKDYDGTTAAGITVGTLSGVLEGESVGVTASGASCRCRSTSPA